MANFDLAAINDRGVYAICYDDGTATAHDFIAEILAEGGAIKRLPRREAVERYTAYLNATWPEFAALSGGSPRIGPDRQPVCGTGRAGQ